MGTATSTAPRTLAEDLRARTDDELEALLRARPDLCVPVPADVTALATRATVRVSVLQAVDRLDRFNLHVVEALAVLPEPTTPQAVQALLAAPMDAVRDALASLRTQAIVWGTPHSLRLVRTAYEILGPYPAGLGPPLVQALQQHPPTRLATIASDLDLEVSGDPGTDAAAIADAVTGRLGGLLDEVGDDAVAALRTLAVGPPSGRVDDARRTVDRAGARTAIERLLAVGLLVPTDSSTVVLPREIGLHLRGGVLRPSIVSTPPEPPVTERDPATVDRTAGAGAAATVRRVETLLETWSEQPPAVLRTGGIGVRDLRRLPGLLDVDEIDAALLVEVAHAAGLLAPGGDIDEVWLPTPAYDAWLRDEPAGQWTTLLTAWLDTSRAPGLVGGRDDRDRVLTPLSRDLDRPLAPEVRRLVLQTLSALPAGAAPDPDGVAAAVRWRRPRRGGQLRDDLVRWTVREAESLGVTGHGGLASYTRPLTDGRPPEAARKAVTAALATVLPEPLEEILLQADLTAVAPGPLRRDLGRDLAAMADVESRGGATVHRFTSASIRRALDAGWTAADIHAFVDRISRTPVPQPLTYLIDDVARLHGRVRVGGAAAFVRCDDESVLSEILANPKAAPLGLRRIAPTVLASAVEPGMLLERLRGLGFAPVPEAPDGSVLIARAEPRRTPPRPAPAPVVTGRPIPSEATLAATVRAVRAGDRAPGRRPTDAVAGRPGRSDATQTLAILKAAVTDGATVWIGYVDEHGAASDRVVDPVRLEGGWLTAFDHRSGEVRSFAVHRISGVAAAGPGA